ADIKISAPTEEVLDKVMGQMIELGAVVGPRQEHDAELKSVTQAGVAPEDFLATTIYPTEVRVRGKWMRVQDQSMDDVIVVDEKHGVARCTLLRNLKAGDQVVVGSKGIRTVRKAEARDVRGPAQADHEFSF